MSDLRHPLCFLRGLWWNLRYAPRAFWQGAWLSGHSFVEQPTEDPKVLVLKCETCGYESVGTYQ